MSATITCPACGAKVRADRDRCPRCRERFAAPPDQADIARRSRRLATWAAGLLGAAILTVGGVWLFTGEKADRPAPRGADPLASRRGAGSARPQAVPRDNEERFYEPSHTGAVAYEQGDVAGALAQFQAAVEKNPQDAESLSNLGQVLVRLGRVAEALPYYERAIAIIPDRWAYRFNHARALGLLGRMDESIAGYRQAQALFPNDYATTFNLGLALHKKGDEAAAVEEYRKAIALDPTDASFRMALAISLDRLQKREDAAAAYSEYLRLAPDAPDAERVRARVAELAAPTPGS